MIFCLQDALSHFLKANVRLAMIVDSKDLYESLPSQTNRGKRGYVHYICYNYETSTDLFGCIPGSYNLTDVGMKNKRPLVEAYFPTCVIGIINFDFESIEIASKRRSLG